MVLNPRQNGVTMHIDIIGENLTSDNKFISLSLQMSCMVHQSCVCDQRFFK